MSILVDSVSLIPGAIVVRSIFGLGVPGADIPANSYLKPYVSLPADAAVEFRGEVLSDTFPAGTFAYYDDGTTSVTAPNGTYSFTFRLYRDGVAQSPLVTQNVYVGPSGGLALNGQIDSFASALALSGFTASELGISAQIEPFAASLVLGTLPSVSIFASLDSFVSLMPLIGDIAGDVPPSLSMARQYRVNPDVHLDAYSVQKGLTLSWEKDPQASLDYSIDWVDWLADVPGDSIANLYVTKSDGVSVSAQAIRGTVTAVVVKGGEVGVWETITVRVSTAQGRLDERTIKLLITER